MKKCCLSRGHITCGDCEESDRCEIIEAFITQSGYKYAKYKQALELIRAHDYISFMKAAENWKNAYGKYEVGTLKEKIAR
ncbi:MAG: hypothetical protein V8R57_01860 [Evtepia sp.]